MKHTASLLTFGIIFSTILILGFACSKTNKGDQCLICKPSTAKVEKDISIAGVNLTIGIHKHSTKRNLTIAKVSKENEVTASIMERLIKIIDNRNEFESLLLANYKPVNYHVYIDKDIHSKNSFSDNEIKAVSIIMYKDNGLHHFLFLKNERQELVIDSRFNAETRKLLISDQLSMFDHVIKSKDDDRPFTLIALLNPVFVNTIKNVTSENELSHKLSRMSFISAGIQSKLPYPGDDECDPEVCEPIQDTPGACEEVIGGWACVEEEDECPIRLVARSNNTFEEYLEFKNMLYYMRDSILANSHNGVEIIDNYYIAGKYINQHISSVNVNELYDYVSILVDKCNFMLENEQAEEVLINSELSSQMLNSVNNLRNLDATQEWQDCLNWMENLITNFTNVSTGDVFVYINS